MTNYEKKARKTWHYKQTHKVEHRPETRSKEEALTAAAIINMQRRANGPLG